jgi:hypothetical protein
MKPILFTFAFVATHGHSTLFASRWEAEKVWLHQLCATPIHSDSPLDRILSA